MPKILAAVGVVELGLAAREGTVPLQSLPRVAVAERAGVKVREAAMHLA